jgi:hypothetical protein
LPILSSIERLIGLSGVDESFLGKGIIDEDLCNAAMGSQASYLANSYDMPALLGANRYYKISAPNLVIGNDEKAICYTKNINGKRTLILAFRGTVLPSEWLTDANFFSTQVEFSGQKLDVHRGFLNHFNGMKDTIYSVVSTLIALENVTRIIVTGHSLGGAVANLAALFLRENFDVPVYLITFEAPKVFRKKNAVLVEDLLGDEHIKRFADKHDLVVKVGCKSGEHVGRAADSSWNIIECSGYIEAHSMYRVVGNIAIFERLLVKDRNRVVGVICSKKEGTSS